MNQAHVVHLWVVILPFFCTHHAQNPTRNKNTSSLHLTQYCNHTDNLAPSRPFAQQYYTARPMQQQNQPNSGNPVIFLQFHDFRMLHGHIITFFVNCIAQRPKCDATCLPMQADSDIGPIKAKIDQHQIDQHFPNIDQRLNSISTLCGLNRFFSCKP